ncbi:MAG TPA: radical SAM protein [Elusimicrobiales bacterium]|nr:radical SAM protein [Elusimicrobiales bacterium]HOL62873.1 radical SAM protein [Elusimicrobiales bacterium]HPO94951.1 radical SAM protein [Elusimicrobiales bacterium]
MLSKINKITILVGNKCNYKCSHCLFSSNVKDYVDDFSTLISEINLRDVNKLLFVGGEPTLYIKEINKILSKIKNLGKKEIIITTNGWFASDISKTEKTLKSFIKLNSVQMSYDRFHMEFSTLKKLKTLYNACLNLKKDFSVILSISNIKDLIILKKLNDIGSFRVGIQKVYRMGSAFKNQIYFKETLNKNFILRKCPLIKNNEIIYIRGKGFSFCCSNLFFSRESLVVYKNINFLMRSELFNILKKYNFREMANKYKINIKYNNVNNECDICEEIWKNQKL